jgi:hypothetical protein
MYKSINDFLQAIMLALCMALMIGVTAMALTALVSFLER